MSEQTLILPPVITPPPQTSEMKDRIDNLYRSFSSEGMSEITLTQLKECVKISGVEENNIKVILVSPRNEASYILPVGIEIKNF